MGIFHDNIALSPDTAALNYPLERNTTFTMYYAKNRYTSSIQNHTSTIQFSPSLLIFPIIILYSILLFSKSSILFESRLLSKVWAISLHLNKAWIIREALTTSRNQICFSTKNWMLPQIRIKKLYKYSDSCLFWCSTCNWVPVYCRYAITYDKFTF